MIRWLPWALESFERARAERKPILLSLSATWCHWCHEMDRTTYADPRVAELVGTAFVPVRVDADRRPDISERYMLGGLPTTAFLTADGDVIAGGNYVPSERMSGVLEQVARAFASRQHEIGARAGGSPAEESSFSGGDESLDHLIEHVFETYDEQCAGFGTEPKFPLVAPVLLALDIHNQRGDDRMRTIAETTLDAMAGGAIYDAIDGGFFRYATTRDWQLPHAEKMLDVNAALLRAYVHAAGVMKAERYREQAAALVQYVGTWLADPDGGWWGSQRADDEYYALSSADERRRVSPPDVDATLYAGWNSAMVSAMLHASQLLDDRSVGESAMASLERILLTCYGPGGGVAHFVDGDASVRGLLDDQVAAVEAALDAYDATGNITYEMVGEEVGHFMLRVLWDEPRQSFLDRAPLDGKEDIGLLRTAVTPFVSNCEAARVLLRLDQASGHHDFGDKARAVLARMRPLAWGRGPQAAHFVLAVRASQGL
jgi:uncharacterized protein